MNNISNKQNIKNNNNNSKYYQYNEDNNLPLTKQLNAQSLSDKFSKNNMIVAVRARPLSKNELEDSNYNTISVTEKDRITVTVPTEYVPDDMSEIYLAGEQIKITKVKEVTYTYDFVFGEKTPQDEVYRCTTSNLLKQVVEGYSATILAYGATGSGKTYTMVGKGENCGLMIRSIRDLFRIINNDKSRLYSIKISYVEVYNEVLKDLLSDKNKTPPELRADPIKGVVLQGAENKKVMNEDEAFKLITIGNKRRTEKQTDRNKFSSRSHAVLQIYLEIQDQLSNINYNDTSFGKFILVDLAGSEKTSSNIKSNAETGSINKSLLALGKCINLIVSQNKKFIPFRESKLTRILQEPLSGNGRIVMIATVSPAVTNFDETMFTLQFANRAKSMKIHMKKNVVETDKVLVKKYTDYIETLKAQINEVEKDIIDQQNMSSANISFIENDQKDSIQNSANNSHYAHIEEYDQIQKNMIAHFQEEVNLKKKIVEEEKKIEDIKNECSDLDYEIIHNPQVSIEYLKSQIESKQKEIEGLKEIINNEYIKESELKKKRKEFNEKISEINSKNPGNAQIKNLLHIYQYYTNLIENISNEHRKYVNLNELKRKENKISILTEQLDLRDLFIDNANQELDKNNITFEFNDPNLASKEEIELTPYNPPKMNVLPAYRSFNSTKNKNNNKNNNNYNKDLNNTKSDTDIKNINNKNTIETDSQSINFSKLKNANRIDRYNDINKFRNKVKFAVSKDNINNYKRNTSLNQNGRTLMNAGENAVNNYYGQQIKRIPNRQNYIIDSSEINNDNQSLLQNLILKKNDNVNKNLNLNNYNDFSFYDYKNAPVQVTNTTRLENEVQKKVKTILKKDFIGRYKRSPYLRILNE